MAVLVVVKVQGMAFAARMAMAIPRISREDVGRIGPVDCGLQLWRRGMAVGAPVFMDNNRTVGDMAERYAGRVVKDDAVTGCRVVDRTMGRRGLFVPVTGKAVDCCLVGVIDYILYFFTGY